MDVAILNAIVPLAFLLTLGAMLIWLQEQQD